MKNILTAMNQSKSGPAGQPPAMRQFGWAALCLLVLLGLLFREGFLPGRTIFSNDGPLGAISSTCARLPGCFSGYWADLNWLGSTGPSAAPDLSSLLSFVLGSLLFSKVYAPFAILFLGLSAWLCFWQWRLSPLACLLGGIAAALNSGFFSTACWGVAAQPLSFGLDFLALAALADQSSPKRWVRVALAGLAVGMGVMEAFDIGAIFSMAIAAFVLFQALAGQGAPAQRLIGGAGRLAVVVVFACFIAASTVSGLVGTQIKGVANMGQDAESKARRWDEATQWSMPKAETLSILIPGIYGFRMDTPMGLPEWLQDHYKGGNYWGRCGRDAAWDRYFAALKEGKTPERPRGFIRYGGGGPYAGVVVVFIGLWGVLQAFRKEKSVFPLAERKFIWFWSGLGLACVLLGFGRFAPVYQFFYALPGGSSMRNPGKFFHVVEWILVILFAYGVHGLSRSCLQAPAAIKRGLASQLQNWWPKAAAFDRKWVKGSLIALAASLLGWWMYSASRERLVAYLQAVDFDSTMAGAIAGFSIRQVGWFILFLALAAGLVIVMLSGYFNGQRARTGALLLGLIVAADLGRADVPWVVTWNWPQKYATNPVIDFLREKPYEHRVARLPFPVPQGYGLFKDLYDIEWLQQLFQYYNIQSLDQIMNPRPREDQLAFETALLADNSTNTVYRLTRRWELTNTRYLLGAAPFLDVLNQQIDPVQHRFRYAVRFEVVPKPGIANPTGLEELTAVITPEGRYAVFDFTGALPRARLYAHWQVNTNDEATLTKLGSAGFDPAQAVLVADPLPAPAAAGVTNQDAGTVEFTSYAPKQIVLQAKAGTPAVLLLNDRFDPNWKVSVDGKPGHLLRCNFVMRGVYLQPGTHTVEFRFQPPSDTLYVSLAAIVVGLLLLGYLAVGTQRRPAPAPEHRREAGRPEVTKTGTRGPEGR